MKKFFQGLFVGIVSAVIISIFWTNHSRIRNTDIIEEENALLRDSLRVLKSREGTSVYEKNVLFFASPQDLKKRYPLLHSSYQNVFSPTLYTNIVYMILIDSIEVESRVERDTLRDYIWRGCWEKRDPHYLVSGRSEINTFNGKMNTYIDSLLIKGDIDIGVKKKENTLVFDVTSSNPHYSFERISPLISKDVVKLLNSKPQKKFNFGITAGWSLCRDINSQKWTTGPGITIGLSFNF